MKTDTIDEGQTLDFVIHAFIVLAFGTPIVLIHPALYLLPLAIGIALFSISAGIEVDVTNVRIRKYKAIAGYKWGNWKELKKYKAAHLKFHLDNSSNEFGLNIAGMYVPQSGPARSYDLVFTDENNNAFEFNHFVKYSKALSTVKALKDIKSLEVVNKFEDKLFRQLNKRRR